uniref:GmrSD restriction endonucleases N-terminal domain-containing protein n=1 Tax=Candidatus Kentrum sp. MB TaxID=2138164 RepID=A0A451B9R3_9GAMM|nr:MAG: Protein of unknown function DUF262 [Candidatus Kentron sp. MB]VFK30061.1 MAG: Protein of unknown function DUF262 [Candidatus Kentron sp. MB]VFK75034.1 MAG: Protein of unknown function DUF262 [Candidatus Kentron sp. MB]
MPGIEETDARIEFERENRSPTDLEFEPITSEDEDYESAPSDYEINTYPADFTLEVLHRKWKEEEILIPDFQRRFVWKQTQASKLVESFLVGLPVPAVFLYKERKSQKSFVIDGQQRLKSIFFFFEGYFGLEERGTRRVFTLTGLSPDSKFANRRFEDFQEEDKRRLRDSVLRAFVVQQLDPQDDTSMYHIFERLNTGGTLLTNQEIRNCVFHGRFIEFLDELNKDPSWQSILGKSKPDTHRKDIELIVRFFAMRNIDAYKKPMKDFLSGFMKKNRDASKETLAESREIFTRTCDGVVASLGEKPFHIRAGLNAAVFDSVMTAFSKHLEEIPGDIKGRYDRLTKSAEFGKHTRNWTTDEETVRTRFRLAETELFD